ncbi:hypothetical protein [Bradyrhizobium sp.]|uniref:hypothetical protein n=1 Tax=Bradyrhizobium sp. TaxID=376 RepID=UPI002CCB0D55|nr:hypothetical protein [Bradyrhizobium sp.]HMM87985.1 hypothetical protein [Bradyrhizobium sp.]
MTATGVKPFRDKMILSYVEVLRASMTQVTWQIESPLLRELYDAKDYTGVVKFVRDSMNLKLRVRVGLVNKGDDPSLSKNDAPAWVVLPNPMPPLNSRDFEKTIATVFIRKSFLEGSKYESVIQAIAHEMAHIVLESLRHPLHSEEPAVDLTAMWLGYRDIFVAGADYVEVGPSRFVDKLIAEYRRHRSGDLIRHYTSLGYLSPEEVCFAARQMGWRSGYMPRPEPRGSVRFAASIVSGMMRAGPLLAIVLFAVLCWLFAAAANGIAYVFR